VVCIAALVFPLVAIFRFGCDEMRQIAVDCLALASHWRLLALLFVRIAFFQ
jgi:hypothetical protein